MSTAFFPIPSSSTSLLLLLLLLLSLIVSSSTSQFLLLFVNALSQTRRVEGGFFDSMFRAGFSEENTDLIHVGTFTQPGAMVSFNITSMTMIGAEGSIADTGEDRFVAATADGNGFGYFSCLGDSGTAAKVVQYNLATRARTGGASGGSADEDRLLGAVRVNSTHIVFTSASSPGRLVYFQTTPTFERSGALSGITDGKDNLFFKIFSDPSITNFAFVTTRTNPSTIIKFNLATTQRISRVEAVTGEDEFQGGILVQQEGTTLFGYFGSTGSSSNDGRIVKFNLDTMERLSALVGESGEFRFYSFVPNPERTALYVGIGSASPAKVVCVSIDSSTSMQRLDSATANRTSDRSIFLGFGPYRNNYAVYALDQDPGALLEFQLSSTTTSTTTSTTLTSSSTTTSTTEEPTTASSTTTSSSTTTTTVTQQETSASSSTTTTTDETTTTPTSAPETTLNINSSTTQQQSTSNSDNNNTASSSSSTSTPTLVTSLTQPTSSSSMPTTTSLQPSTTTSTMETTNETTTTIPEPITTNTSSTAVISPSPSPPPPSLLFNFTPPGLDAETQQQLEAAALVSGVVAGILASPTSILTAQRSLAVFSLVGCPIGSPTQQTVWITSSLKFPMTLFPGISVGDEAGGHYRLAVVGFLFVGFPIVLALTLGIWYIIRRKKILKYLPSRQKKIQSDQKISSVMKSLQYFWFLLTIAPLPYSIGLYSSQIAGQMATATGVLSSLSVSSSSGDDDGSNITTGKKGDGIFVDLILLTIIPWGSGAFLLYLFVSRIRYSVFGKRYDDKKKENNNNQSVDDDIELSTSELVDDKKISAESNNKTLTFLQKQVNEEIGNKNQIGMVLSKFFVTPDPKTPKWLYLLKKNIVKFLITPPGRFFIAGHVGWAENKIEDYVRVDEIIDDDQKKKKTKEKEVEETNSKSNTENDEEKNVTTPTTTTTTGDSDKTGTPGDEQQAEPITVRNSSFVSSTSSSAISHHTNNSSHSDGNEGGTAVSKSVFFDCETRSEQLHAFVASENIALRFRSLFQKMVGPPLSSELRVLLTSETSSSNNNNKKENNRRVKKIFDKIYPYSFVSKYRIYFAPFTIPTIVCTSVIVMFAEGVAKTNMETHCQSSLIVITIMNLLILLYSFFCWPFVVPFRNISNLILDIIVAVSSVVALLLVGTSNNNNNDGIVAAVQVVTSTSVTVGSLMDLTLTGTRNFLFVILNIKIVSGAQKKKLEEEFPPLYVDDEEDEEDENEIPLLEKNKSSDVEIEKSFEQEEQTSPVSIDEVEAELSTHNNNNNESSSDDDFEYDVDYNYDRDENGRRKSIPSTVSKTFDTDLMEAYKRAAVLSEAVDEKKNSMSPPTSPRRTTRHGNNDNDDDDDDDILTPRRSQPCSPKKKTIINNRNEFRRQQEVALASVLYHICKEQKDGNSKIRTKASIADYSDL